MTDLGVGRRLSSLGSTNPVTVPATGFVTDTVTLDIGLHLSGNAFE
jgi:hypothetical protein